MPDGTQAPTSAASPNSPTLIDNGPIERVTRGDIFVPSMAAWDTIFRQSFWYAGFAPDQLTTLKRYDTADDMLSMAACRSPLNVLLYGCLRKGITVEAATDDPDDANSTEAKARADALKWCLDNILDDAGNPQDSSQVAWQIGLGAWYGFSVNEIIYRAIEHGKYAGKVGFAQFAAKPPQMIGWDLDRETLNVRNIIPYTPATGYGPPVPVEKCVRYTHDPTRNLPHGNGLWRVCYKHYFSLDKNMQIWNVAAQRAGIVFVGFYPPGDDASMEAGRSALDKLQMSAVGMFPNNVKLQDFSPQGEVLDKFKALCDWHVEQMTQAILGNTLSTGEGDRTGSLALGQVHQDTGQDVQGYVRGRLESILNLQVARRWHSWNYDAETDDDDLCPRISLGEYDEGDQQAKAQMHKTLIDGGVEHAQAKHIREDLNLPPMDPKEKALIDGENKRKADLEARQADAKMQGKAQMSASDIERFANALLEVARERRAA